MVVDASASSDADQDPLSFTWDLPVGINATVQGAKVTFVAGEYSQDTSLSFTVTVSDGKATSTASASVLVEKKLAVVMRVLTCGMPMPFTLVVSK